MAIAGIVITQVVMPLQERAAEEERIAQEQARVAEEIQALSTAQIESTVEFGHYEQDNDESNGAEPVSWILLAVEDGKALMLAEKGLDFKQYNSAVKSYNYKGVTTYVYNSEYASSQVKTWLEQEFETQVFSEKELALLTDSATLLTEDEFSNLVPDAYRKCSLTECAFQKRLTYQQQTQYTSIDYEYESEWWLKSDKCAWIEMDGSIHHGIVPTVSSAVRPAIWVDVNTSNGQ